MSPVLAITVSLGFVATGIVAGHECEKEKVAYHVLSFQERGEGRGVGLFERWARGGRLIPHAYQDLQLLSKNRLIYLKGATMTAPDYLPRSL